MPNLRRCVVWSAVFGLVSFVAYYQLQESTATVTEFVIVPAKRRDISEQFFERPQTISDLHPFGNGVSNVRTAMSAEDPQQIKELCFILREKMPSPFGFEFQFDLTFEFVEPDALVKVSARNEFMGGLLRLRLDDSFLLANYKSEKENGTVLIESLSVTAPRVFLTQVFLVLGPSVHRKMLDNVREFFVRKQQE